MAGVRQVDLARHAQPRVLALAQPVEVHVSTDYRLTDPGAGRSFPSSHVVNNFCAATVLTLFYRRWGWLYVFPAALVGVFAGLRRRALAERRDRLGVAGGGPDVDRHGDVCNGSSAVHRPT